MAVPIYVRMYASYEECSRKGQLIVSLASHELMSHLLHIFSGGLMYTYLPGITNATILGY